MPILATFYGIIISMYFGGKEHLQPHFHAWYSGHEAEIDFDGNIIVPPIYYEIHSIDSPLLIVRIGEKDNYKVGMITPDGTPVVPAEFSSIGWCSDNYIICCRDGHCEMLRYEVKNDQG